MLTEGLNLQLKLGEASFILIGLISISYSSGTPPVVQHRLQTGVARDKIANWSSLPVPLKHGVQLPGSVRLTRHGVSCRSGWGFRCAEPPSRGVCLPLVCREAKAAQLGGGRWECLKWSGMCLTKTFVIAAIWPRADQASSKVGHFRQCLQNLPSQMKDSTQQAKQQYSAEITSQYKKKVIM